MSNQDLVLMAIRNLFKRKLRTILTVSGVMIGAAAIVIMISLGIAINENHEEMVSQWGDIRLITVFPPNQWGWDDAPNRDLKLDRDAVEQFRRLDGVSVATGVIDMNVTARAGRFVHSWLPLRGIEPEAMEALGLVPSDGRLLEDSDRMQAVFGIDSPFEFRDPNSRHWTWLSRFNGDEPLVDVSSARMQFSFEWGFGQAGFTSSMRPFNLTYVGMLEEKDWNFDRFVYMHIDEVRQLRIAQMNFENQQQGNSNPTNRRNQAVDYSMAYVQGVDINAVRSINDAIREMGFDTISMIETLDFLSESSRDLERLLGAIGGVSLFIAAIGIANTMIMSTYERTREIGVMKVIGAKIKDIRKLFLIEAMLIGFIGGIFGSGLSFLVSYILNNSQMTLGTTGWGMEGSSNTSSIPLWLYGAALIFSAVIGLIAGFLPARRATRLSALSAIRTE